MHQLSVRSIEQEIDARIEFLERDGIKPLFIIIGKTSYAYLSAEILNKTRSNIPLRAYRDCQIVLDPWNPYYLNVVGDIVEHIARMNK